MAPGDVSDKVMPAENDEKEPKVSDVSEATKGEAEAIKNEANVLFKG